MIKVTVVTDDKPLSLNTDARCDVVSEEKTPCAGSGVVRIDPLRFLAGCRTRRLNLLVLLYILACSNCIVAYYGPVLCTVNFRWYVFCLLVVLVKLSLLAE